MGQETTDTGCRDGKVGTELRFRCQELRFASVLQSSTDSGSTHIDAADCCHDISVDPLLFRGANIMASASENKF